MSYERDPNNSNSAAGEELHPLGRFDFTRDIIRTSPLREGGVVEVLLDHFGDDAFETDIVKPYYDLVKKIEEKADEDSPVPVVFAFKPTDAQRNFVNDALTAMVQVDPNNIRFRSERKPADKRIGDQETGSIACVEYSRLSLLGKTFATDYPKDQRNGSIVESVPLRRSQRVDDATKELSLEEIEKFDKTVNRLDDDNVTIHVGWDEVVAYSREVIVVADSIPDIVEAQRRFEKVVDIFRRVGLLDELKAHSFYFRNGIEKIVSKQAQAEDSAPYN